MLKSKKVLFIILFLLAFQIRDSYAGRLERNLVNAASFGRFEKLKKALKAGANIDGIRNKKTGHTALILSIWKKHTKIALYLLSQGANPNKANKQNKTPLYFAARNGNEKLVKMLLKKGANPFAEDKFSLTPLYMALLKNKYKVLKYFKAAGLDFESKLLKKRWTPLEYAILKKNNESIRELIKLGVKIDGPGDKYPALHKCIFNNNLALVKILMENQVNPLTKDIFGRDAFDVASIYQRKKILLYLYKKTGYANRYINNLRNNKYFYGSRKKGVIIWLYSFETKSRLKPGKLTKLVGSLFAPAESQELHNFSTLSYDAKIKKDKNKNYYFFYSNPLKITPDQPFMGGFMLDMTQYKKTFIPADRISHIKLKQYNYPVSIWGYLQNSSELLINNRRIQAIAKKIRSRSKSYLDLFTNLDKFIHKHLEYGIPPRRPNTAPDVLNFPQGRCGEYAKLRVSLLRAMGIPTRYIQGTAAYNFGPIDLNKKVAINDHKWLEAYIPKIGWLVLPSTYRFRKRIQFYESYHNNYYIRRRGLDGEFKQRQQFRGVKRTGGYYGSGIFLKINSNLFSTLSKVLKTALTYKRPVDISIFRWLKKLPLKAQVVVNWLLISRRDPQIHIKAAENFNRLIKQVPSLKRETFLYASASIVNQRILKSKRDEVTASQASPISSIIKKEKDSIPDILAADSKSAKYRTHKIDSLVKKIPLAIRRGLKKSSGYYLKRLIDYLKKDAANDFVIVKRIHDWVTLNIAYDNDRSTKTKSFSDIPNEILKNQRTQCGGYANLFKKMVNLANIDAQVIYGYSKNYGKKDGRLGTHAWNSVLIDSKWYLVDVTGDIRRKIGNDNKWGTLKKYKDDNLFIHPSYKIRIHFPMKKKFQYLSRSVSLKQFSWLPQTTLWFYKLGLFFNDNTFVNRLTRYIERRKGWTWMKRFDRIISENETIRIKLNAPSNIIFRAILSDQAGNIYPAHSKIDKQNGGIVFSFSAPKKGVFNAQLSAKYADKNNVWKNLYQFQILEVMGLSPDYKP